MTQGREGRGNGAGDGAPGGGRDSAELEDEFHSVALLREEGVHPRMSLTRIHVRIGRRFVSVWWALPAVLIGGIAVVIVAKVLMGTDAVGGAGGFTAAHPCEPSMAELQSEGRRFGIPAWSIATHALNFFIMVMVVRAGWQILADHPRLYLKMHCTPDEEWLRFRGAMPKNRVWTAKDDAITLSPMVGMPGGRHTIGVARHWHFLFDILFVLNGIVFIVLTFASGHWRKLVPTEWSIFPNAVSCLVQYSSLSLPHELGGYYTYDALQQLSYFAIVFVFAPLAILTGIAMSPAMDNHFTWYQKIFGNRQIARSLHFLVMVVFVVFYGVHMLMVAATGFAENLNAITLDVAPADGFNLNGIALWGLAILVVILFNVWAVRFSWTHTRVLQRISNATVGKVMDLLFDKYAPKAEYAEEDISPFFWPNGLVPVSDEWHALHSGGFDDYRLKVTGLVDNPLELSLDDIKALAYRDQITMHNCIQGWSAIGKWSGLPFSALIDLVRPSPEARWVIFRSFGEGGEGGQYYDSHSMVDLEHPQSLLAYGMNDEPLPVVHGAPLRLRVENQLGFKQVKWIKEIEFVHDFRDYGAGLGGYNEDHEFYGYRDEI
ncbi:molybdopterin-dependent oxidoreductase [Tomitella gaofuii]|uniref:molybdopterin-dependent oxidoreductase n=1 Tax=Tomitella gaofuii TaxID=2760083 RepID=UPI0015FC84FC|nr:molybdopterin-dependent oxidoreductase [Tomitella gaofuii]